MTIDVETVAAKLEKARLEYSRAIAETGDCQCQSCQLSEHRQRAGFAASVLREAERVTKEATEAWLSALVEQEVEVASEEEASELSEEIRGKTGLDPVVTMAIARAIVKHNSAMSVESLTSYDVTWPCETASVTFCECCGPEGIEFFGPKGRFYSGY